MIELTALRPTLVGALLPMFCLVACCCEAFPVLPRVLFRPGSPPSQSIPALSASQLLEFVEPTTGVTVKLVGAMHYNPASIALAEETIRDLAVQGRLGSVVIESCDIRWNATMDTDPFLQKLLQSEMRAAHDIALAYQRPLVLGDQRINITTRELGAGLKETLTQLLDPVQGWRAFWGNVTTARRDAIPVGDGFLSAFAFLDPKLLLAAPVSLAKYPLSYVAKAPVTSIAILSLLFFADSAYAVPVDDMTTTDWVGELTGAALETAFFARVFLKELLADRNPILAQNILAQCRYYSPTPDLPIWRRLFHGNAKFDSRRDQCVYAEDSVLPRYENSGKVVVAVLGLAHCNGIKKLLEEQRV
ncbi:predicted protein [Phaeodactylum tricornutum CCAP 1055/1]|jgi:pheromone shutdown protein TraB|uniref:TraB family protein n=1 Tax=Phaeodactylum tricornutum (strain CCAP 1055/1) TaxID=556484 RepID=B5Y4U8_PHATC|nr:predicted protein [Phaeodactylum tricornutum CCAP 1055/1]ACI65540.1 predicted protein [Phaeodactylum tricornutum CCAP 1055/1]|eukprot:XP_002186070.1 predicted protein [Phaeodactylum tricornutum CCAP 1055/1]